jgi:hypothetical protein
MKSSKIEKYSLAQFEEELIQHISEIQFEVTENKRLPSLINPLFAFTPLLNSERMPRELEKKECTDFSTFVIGKILERLLEQRSVGIYKVKGLFGDEATVAKSFIDEYRNLPYRYTIKIPLPSYLYSNLNSYWKENEIIVKEFQLSENHGTVSKLGNFGTVSILCNFLEFQFSGYLRNSSLNNPALISLLKSFFGLQLALGILSYDNSLIYRQLRRSLIDKPLIYDETNKQDLDFQLSESFQLLILKMDVKETNPCFLRNKLYEVLGTAFPKSRENDTEKFKKGLVELFKNAESARLWNACKWYFDCVSSQDEADAFLYGVFCLESLFGKGLENTDKNEIHKVPLGITNTLRERISFLLGKNSIERKILSDTIGEIYSLRSSIAHGGRTHLNYGEVNQLTDLKDICKKAIQKLILQDTNYLDEMNPLGIDL